MPSSQAQPPGRDYAQLLGAMNELLAVLSADGNEEAALRASFEAAARGFGARKALLLLVEEREPRRAWCDWGTFAETLLQKVLPADNALSPAEDGGRALRGVWGVPEDSDCGALRGRSSSGRRSVCPRRLARRDPHPLCPI